MPKISAPSVMGRFKGKVNNILPNGAQRLKIIMLNDMNRTGSTRILVESIISNARAISTMIACIQTFGANKRDSNRDTPKINRSI